MNEIDPQVETNDLIAEVMKIPQEQRVQFKLIQLVGNTKMRLVGVKIVKDLLDNYKKLWKACLVSSSEECCIITLRDLPDKFRRDIDTLYIVPVKNTTRNLKELEKISKLWEPDEIKWISEKHVKSLSKINCPVLRIRWKIIKRI